MLLFNGPFGEIEGIPNHMCLLPCMGGEVLKNMVIAISGIGRITIVVKNVHTNDIYDTFDVKNMVDNKRIYVYNHIFDKSIIVPANTMIEVLVSLRDNQNDKAKWANWTIKMVALQFTMTR